MGTTCVFASVDMSIHWTCNHQFGIHLLGIVKVFETGGTWYRAFRCPDGVVTSVADAARKVDSAGSRRVGLGGVGRAGGSDGGRVLFTIAVILSHVAMGTVGDQTHHECNTIHSGPLKTKFQHLSIVNRLTDMPLLSVCWGFQIRMCCSHDVTYVRVNVYLYNNWRVHPGNACVQHISRWWLHMHRNIYRICGIECVCRIWRLGTGVVRWNNLGVFTCTYE